jgi:hypothetical protein
MQNMMIKSKGLMLNVHNYYSDKGETGALNKYKGRIPVAGKQRGNKCR